MNDTVLIPFGPLRPVPRGRTWCNACGGEGQAYHGREDEKRACFFCNGLGHWGAEEVRAAHERDPERCREECGEMHREWRPPMTEDEFSKFVVDAEATFARADQALAGRE